MTGFGTGLRAVRDPAACFKTPVQSGVTPGKTALSNRRLRWPLLHIALRLLGGTIWESVTVKRFRHSAS